MWLEEECCPMLRDFADIYNHVLALEKNCQGKIENLARLQNLWGTDKVQEYLLRLTKAKLTTTA